MLYGCESAIRNQGKALALCYCCVIQGTCSSFYLQKLPHVFWALLQVGLHEMWILWCKAAGRKFTRGCSWGPHLGQQGSRIGLREELSCEAVSVGSQLPLWELWSWGDPSELSEVMLWGALCQSAIGHGRPWQGGVSSNRETDNRRPPASCIISQDRSASLLAGILGVKCSVAKIPAQSNVFQFRLHHISVSQCFSRFLLKQ